MEIDDADYLAVDSALAAVNRLQTSLGYKLVERNFLDFESIHQFVTITMSLGREFATPDHRTFGEAVMSAAVNWLTAVRLFLDHSETDLKRRFGSSSTQFLRFKTSTSAAYDTRFGYRFTYRFRNYVQHCGLPLSQISIAAPRGQLHRHAKQTVELLLDRDALLDEFDGWSSVKAEIAAMPEQFPFLPLAEEAMEGLRQVHRELLLIELEEAVATIDTLLDALERIRQASSPGVAGVFSTEGDPANPTNISPQLFPVAELIEELGRVRDGERTRESLIGKSVPPPPPKFSPSNIKARFHADSRGVQVLSAWLTEKRPTDRFLQAVDDIVTEDGSTDPLVFGLINVSVVFAHMAGAAIGTTAEGLVAGLLDIYTDA
ncbi:MAG: hypothetical protein WD598_08175 [Acidimicrobiia bacterium]